jgi:hypothetical protein
MEITFAALDSRLAVALMASANTNATDHENPAQWGAALNLETLAHGRLTDRERDALHDLDRLLTAFAEMVSPDRSPRRRAQMAARFISAVY